MRTKVVIITDCTDVAAMEIRGGIFANADNDEFEIEPVVKVPDFNLVNTAFLVRLLADVYPAGTILNVIVHPTSFKGERIIGRTAKKNILFEGTNTGVFGWLVEDLGCVELYELYNQSFVPFGGKYVHAPVVGKLASGTLPELLGRPFSQNRLRRIKINDGTIVHIDNFGNIKFKANLNGKNGDKFLVRIGGKCVEALFWERMMDRDTGEVIIYPGSSFGFPELAVVRGNAAKELGIGWQDTIEISPVIENT